MASICLSLNVLNSLAVLIHPCIEGLVQEKRNSSASAMEFHFSCTNPLI